MFNWLRRKKRKKRHKPVSLHDICDSVSVVTDYLDDQGRFHCRVYNPTDEIIVTDYKLSRTTPLSRKHLVDAMKQGPRLLLKYISDRLIRRTNEHSN